MKQQNDEPEQHKGVGRRSVLGGLGAGLGAASLAAVPRGAEAQTPPAASPTTASTTPFPASRSGPLDRPYNVILITTDEEAYHLRPAEGFTTPARAELQRRGTSFVNHYIGSAMCTPSRGVIYSGQPPQVNGVFDQMETGYVPSLRTDRPSMGTVFRELGYHTAYFGKFELRRDIVVAQARRELQRRARGVRLRQLFGPTATRWAPLTRVTKPISSRRAKRCAGCARRARR